MLLSHLKTGIGVVLYVNLGTATLSAVFSDPFDVAQIRGRTPEAAAPPPALRMLPDASKPAMMVLVNSGPLGRADALLHLVGTARAEGAFR